ncbi:DUF350 domain-containing protein [Leptolyngbya sp. FACHB-321]|uniref:DUF350 domain-containing protein n=1 Tax=Leptolyngbya sp. FACHB-321 TaxID=2692807 RepID=UPI001688060F|nr:DUF350 domain-containing protein [Leptolyngbya sp. FACHB-321]MBD2034750.1 DUF350 domain-containing protein [Leptolyngbya sp. FACHB-321]
MNPFFLDGLTRIGFVITELAVGFGIFWLGQLAYQKLFRRMDLNLELFVRDNPAVAIALVGYNFGIILALAGVLDKEGETWLDQLLYLASYGAGVILLMLVGAWVGDRLILRRCDCAREIVEEQNVGAASAEAGVHIANGLVLSAALGGQSGTWIVGLVCWAVGLGVLVLVSALYPRVVHYNVFREICKRNNPATGVALAGLLIATGNVVRVAFTPEFQNWTESFTQYFIVLGFCLLALALIRWLADLVLVPGVKISDEIVNQSIPNLGAGLIEAFAYIAGSFLLTWSV